MKIQLNRAFRGMQGVMDDVIYKRFEDQTISVSKPKPFTGPPTAAQVRARERFTEAASYATAVMRDPVRLPVYAAAAKAIGRQSVFPVIMGDFLNLPEVKEIDLVGYNGRVGDAIKIKAVDDFEVVSVKVTIRNAAGATLEEGLATKGDTRWIYLAQSVAPTDQTLTIEAEASDRPGNQRSLSETWHA